jgi:hypothetical protein
MRAFTKAAIVAAVAAVVAAAAAVLALVPVAKAVATEKILEVTAAAAQAMQKESSSGAREAATSCAIRGARGGDIGRRSPPGSCEELGWAGCGPGDQLGPWAAGFGGR